MDVLADFIKKTKEIHKHFENEYKADERDRFIEELQQLLNERGQLLKELPDLSHLHQDLKKEFVKLEREIQDQLANEKDKIKQDLKTLQQQKKQNDKYADPYGSISADGMFLDKKK